MKHFLPAIILLLFPGFRSTAQSVRADLHADQENKPALMACVSACQGVLGENIYPNGDFGAGQPNVILVDPGLAPGYLYQPGPPPNDGYYTIANSTATWGWFAGNLWIDIEDNGPEANGYMMVVNASYAPGMFFQNTVAVCENTMYEFSIDVINVFESAYTQSIKPNLTFLVDGIAYCETGDIPIDEQWHTARFSFTTSPGQTSVVLGMRNNAPGGYGNDLAIDNISFRACGPEIVSQDTSWYCPGSPTQLQVELLNTPFDTTVYQWQIWQNNQWEDIPGADSINLTVNNPQNGQQYRLLAASALPNLQALNCRAVSQTIRLYERPPIQVQTTGVDITCFGQNNAGVHAQALQGDAPFTYLWNTGSAAEAMSGLSAGPYTVTVTDANGCTGAGAVTVAEPPLLVADATAQAVSCFNGDNGQVIAAASGGTLPYTFSWDNSAAGDTISHLSAGVYSLTVTDANGCSVATTAEVASPTAISAITSQTPVSCFGGQDGSAQVATSGGMPPYSFLWNQDESTPQISQLSAGQFTLTITDAAGCTTTTSAVISEPSELSVSSSTSPVSCHGGQDAGAMAVGGGGTGPYTFNWNTGQTSATINGLTAGAYSLTITDAHGCTASAESVITEPLAISMNMPAGFLACFGGNNASITASAVGGTAPLNYHWNTGQTSSQINGLSGGSYTVTVTDANGCTLVAFTEVYEPPALHTTTTSQDVACFGSQNGAASVETNGGTPPYSWLWNQGQTTAQISGLSPGMYVVTVSDAQGCTNIASSVVEEPAPLIAANAAGGIACFGAATGTAVANPTGGTPPYQFNWSNGQTTAQIQGLSAGDYLVTVTDAQGCTTWQSTTITQPTALLATGGATDNLCHNGQDGSAWILAEGGSAPYAYFWNNGQTVGTLSGLSAGSYAVTVTDINGCTVATNVQVNQPPALAANVVSTAVSCAGGADGVAAIQPSGGIGPYQFWWSNAQTGPVTNGLTAGLYTVVLTDANGCTTAATAVVTEPAALLMNVQVQHVTCFGAANGQAAVVFSGGTAPYTALWQNGQTSSVIQQLTAGEYAVTLTDAHGCSLSSNVQVQQPDAALTSQIQAQPVDCYGAETGMAAAEAGGGTPPYTFSWETGQTSAQLGGLPSGWYQLTITDAQQCTEVAVVQVDQPPPMNLQITAWPTACAEVATGQVFAAASGGSSPYQYAWSNGAMGSGISELPMGSYIVTVTDENGCTEAAAQSVAAGPPPTIDLGLDQTVYLGEEIVLTAQTNLPSWRVANYQWSGDAADKTCPDCASIEFQPKEDGCEMVTVYTIDGCIALDEVCYDVVPRRNIYVPNIFHPDDDGHNDYFTIYSDASVRHIRYLRVYDRWGNQVFQANETQTNHEPSGWDGTYRGQLMNPGVFVWVAEVEFIDGEVVLLKGDVTLYR